jgi:hypothetical protein
VALPEHSNRGGKFVRADLEAVDLGMDSESIIADSQTPDPAPLPTAAYQVTFTGEFSALDMIAFGQFVNHCKDKMTQLKIRVVE